MKPIDQSRKEYLEIIRNMTPENRLQKCFELNELTKQLFLTGLKDRFPDFSEKEIKEFYLKRIDKCRNLNY
jgi:hypothetical protein